jgi:hypothetical protein
VKCISGMMAEYIGGQLVERISGRLGQQHTFGQLGLRCIFQQLVLGRRHTFGMMAEHIDERLAECTSE